MKCLLPLLLVLSGCYLHTPMEPPELCYTLRSLVVGDGCVAADVEPWETEVFMHDIPDHAVDGVWVSSTEEREVLYEIHPHDEHPFVGFVTAEEVGVLGGQCRMTFMLHLCEASYD
jgi:hypothetical protein